tara:strand:+ start:29 stop:226 length:198 start_codon:yes stop_codon:yes gene_type:complete
MNRKVLNLFYKSKRFVSKIIKSKKIKTVAKISYHTYEIYRVYRNPFVLLEYLSLYNGLRLIANKI